MQSEKQGIFVAINKVLKELSAVGKDSVNTNQGFKFRSLDAICDAINPLFAEHGIHMEPQVLERERWTYQTARGGTMHCRWLMIKYTFRHIDGSYIETITAGEGSDPGDKASNKAMSFAFKYALSQIFCIRTTDDPDPDGFTPDQESRPKNIVAKQGVSRAQEYQNAENQPAASAPRPGLSSGRSGSSTKKYTTISDKQASRLYAISNKSGWDNADMKALIKELANVTSSKDIPPNKYEEIVNFVQSNPPPSQENFLDDQDLPL